MSVKQMTTEQIRDDLTSIAMTWPEGVPWQQQDRVTALKGELKRRGESFDLASAVTAAVQGKTERPIKAMEDDELEAELRKASERLSRNPGDEATQKRFADIRYELRARTKAGAAEAPEVRKAPIPLGRELELPDDDELPAKPKSADRVVPLVKDGRTVGKAYVDGGTTTGIVASPEILDEIRAASSEPKKPYSVEGKLQKKKLPLSYGSAKTSASVNGFTADAKDDGTVVFEYNNKSGEGVLRVGHVLTIDEVTSLIAILKTARAGAREALDAED